VIEMILSSEAPAPSCHFKPCSAAAQYTPVLCIALVGRQRVSRVALPTHVCCAHRERFARGFLTPERRSTVDASLRASGRAAPDWLRTHIDFAD
jgi:hypothetical protein